MKIDTSHINLSSNHSYFEQNQLEINQKVEFSNLFDNRLRQYQIRAGEEIRTRQKSSAWHEISMLNGQETVSLSDQFVLELEKLQQIL